MLISWATNWIRTNKDCSIQFINNVNYLIQEPLNIDYPMMCVCGIATML